MGIHRSCKAKTSICMHSITTVYQLKKLKALDRLATRSTTTIKRNTPQASIEIMVDLMPIELMIQKTGISAYISLKKTTSHTILSESGVSASAHALSQLHVHACRPELASTET